ncbi:hypothetical protein FDUTEX481_01826 [Tolypothrix sp. PCC 7601]|nr:hypothetical protein FDUTEX481_01826 [Tolypothrix sp. PCC 7601]
MSAFQSFTPHQIFMKSTPTQLHAIAIRLTLNWLYMIIILA